MNEINEIQLNILLNTVFFLIAVFYFYFLNTTDIYQSYTIAYSESKPKQQKWVSVLLMENVLISC